MPLNVLEVNESYYIILAAVRGERQHASALCQRGIRFAVNRALNTFEFNGKAKNGLL